MTTVSEDAFSSEELEIVKNALAELDVSMNADIKQRWVEALRSGKYKQGSSCLKVNDSYCCLGALCELHRQDFPDKGWQRASARGQLFGYISKDEAYLPPEEISDWASLGLSAYELLSDVNDSGADFPTIASLIEEML